MLNKKSIVSKRNMLYREYTITFCNSREICALYAHSYSAIIICTKNINTSCDC